MLAYARACSVDVVDRFLPAMLVCVASTILLRRLDIHLAVALVPSIATVHDYYVCYCSCSCA